MRADRGHCRVRGGWLQGRANEVVCYVCISENFQGMDLDGRPKREQSEHLGSPCSTQATPSPPQSVVQLGMLLKGNWIKEK